MSRRPRLRPLDDDGRAGVIPDARISSDQDADSNGRSAHGDERSALQLYLNDIRRTALLTPEEENRLAIRIRRGDEAAREHMIRANLRLVVKIAYDYNHLGLPLMDLISEGNLGLIKAVERFDSARGGKLSTYAAWWIKQSMKRAVANQSKTIRLPVHLVDRIARMRRYIAHCMEQFGREPDNDEIAFELQIPANKVALLKTVSVRPASLEAPLGDDADARVLGDIVGDEGARSPDEHLGDKNALDDLNAIVNSLPRREAEIITLRFGLEGENPLTLEEVGRKFNITRERIRQLQDIALRQLRRRMQERNKQRSLDDVHEENRAVKRAEIIREFIAPQAAKCAG
jgi:RNA polymerase primary sigma factor